MDKPKELWFKDIPRPELFLNNSQGYLDRLSDGANGKDRQYLGKRKFKGSQNNQEKRRHKTNTKTQPQITPESLIDDAKWLDERRKKFPRVNSKREPEQSDLSSTVEVKSHIARNNKHTARPPHQVSKTKNVSLFDRLMGNAEE